MSSIIEGTLKGTPIGKLAFDALGINAWWEVDAGKFIKDSLIPSADAYSSDAYSQQQMSKNPIAARRSIYGRAMVSGSLTYINEAGDDNEYLYFILPLAAHKCDAVEEIWFDDVKAYSNGAMSSDYADHARVGIHLGDQTAADADFVAECSNWTTAHVGFGVTYLAVRLKYDPDFWTSGLPNVKALIRGKPIYDPRQDSTNGGSGTQRVDDDSTWAWSDNWALCVLDYTLFEAGIGALPSEVNFPSFAAAANDSDQLVQYNTSGDTEARYTCNGTCTQAQAPTSVLDQLLTAGAGMMSYISGQYHLWAGVYQGPYAIELTEADVAGNIELRPFNERANLFNAVKGTYVDPDSSYQQTDFPPYESSYYRAQDNDEYIASDIDLPFTQSVYTAQRMAKLKLELVRAGQQIVVPLNMVGLAITVGTVVKLTLPRLGIDAEYQVIDRNLDFGEPITVTLRQTGAALYDYAMGSYTDKPLVPGLNLPDPAVVPTPKNLAFEVFAADATQLGQLTWDAPGGISSYLYRIEIVMGDFTAYQANISGTVLAVPRIDAGNYTIKVWAINNFGNRSNNPATLALAVDTAPEVTSIDVVASLFELNITPQTTVTTATSTVFNVKGGLSNDIANATLIGTGKNVVWTGRMADTTYYLWAQTTNDYGQSAWFGPVQTKTSGDNSTLMDALAQSITESQLGQALLSKITLATEAGSSMADALAAAHKSIDDAKEQLLLAQNDISGQQQNGVEYDAKITVLDAARAEIDSRLGTVESNIGSIDSRVETVETTSTDNAERLTVVESSAEDSASRVVTLEQASASQAQSITDLETSDGTQNSRLTSVEQTNATQATQISNLTTSVGNNSSSITQLNQTTSAQAQSITDLETSDGTQNSRLTSVEQTNATQATQISNLTTSVGNNTSSITTLQQTDIDEAERVAQLKVEKDNASAEMLVQESVTAGQVQRTSLLEVRAGESESRIVELDNVTATQAIQITQLESTTGDNTAAIEQTAQTVADLDGNLQAMWKVSLGVTQDGKYYAAGFGSSIENTDQGLQSSFYVLANRFAILNQETGTSAVTTPFVVENGQVLMNTAMIENLQNKTLIQNLNGQMIAMSPGFGSSSQFIFWFGPDVGDLSNCTESAATLYMTTAGALRGRGTLFFGSLTSQNQSTDKTDTASVTIGPFSSDGGLITINASYLFSTQYQFAGTCPVSPVTPSVTIVLERKIGAATTWSTVMVKTIAGSFNCIQEGSDAIENENISDGWTYQDNLQTTSDRTYRLRISSRTINVSQGVIDEQLLGLISEES
ncbi:DUF1983 domain-containing protein [Shewanella yunxiaonensis]|uniref:DUF1983 domain-containing protein n=1 Tax=Shewanella yunxiaonensis TaxID=2829809 RepID=A0ABX7YVV2_9GAMM|nr:DUF1983 domain-containing protein [Shewanella yunxiaonensis]QUN06424.1 DUF1983 domain-containing protein [Shewanella yunxiaonensis]